MNFLTFGLILICCHVWAIETNANPAVQDASDEFLEFLERFRDIIKEGNDTIGMPILDPFIRDQMEVHTRDLMELDAILTNIEMYGLSDYVINSSTFKFIPPSILLDITMTITAKADYENLIGKIESNQNYEFYGNNGNIDIIAKNIRFIAKIDYTLSNDNWDKMIVTEVQTMLSLQQLHFKAIGLFNDERASTVMSFLISEITPKLINDKQEMITGKLNANLKEICDKITSKWTWREILDMLRIHV